jgi:peptidoglycan/LPS O-acetylase OafA/YrhL
VIEDAQEHSTALVRPYMPELDSLRGVAILLVLLFHGFSLPTRLEGLAGAAKAFVAIASQGWAGVNLFFVLSGFLITGILLETKTQARYYRNFYLRRALRILPAYYLVLVVLALARGHTWLAHQCSWSFLLLSAVYLSNVTPLFGVRMSYGPLWSLAVEEHFYFVWPVIVRRLSERAVARVAIGIIVAVPVLRAITFAITHSDYNFYTWLVADGLAWGALLAVLARRRSRAEMKRITLLLFIAAGVVFAAGAPLGIFSSHSIVSSALRLSGINLVCSGVLLTTLLIGTSDARSLVSQPTLRFLGEISYGLYLVHVIVFDAFDHITAGDGFPTLAGNISALMLRFLVASGLSIVIALCSRRIFEEPFLRLKKRLSSGLLDRAAGELR